MSSRWQAIRRARCPRCRVGPIFRRWRFPGFGVLRAECPECGLVYQREQGYFLGAMYMSSLIVTALIFIFLLVLWKLTDWSWDTLLLASLGLVILAAPLVMTAARVLWLHFDQYFDPR
jgi:uncharacterized protein (DUF983 family)